MGSEAKQPFDAAVIGGLVGGWYALGLWMTVSDRTTVDVERELTMLG